ncbi:glutamate--tRNA ligase, partial [Coemansia sp. RSA 1933]
LRKKDLVPVVLDNAPAEAYIAPVARHKKNAELGEKQTVFSAQIFVDQADASTLEAGEEVTLMDWGNAIVESVEKSSDAGGVVVGAKLRLHLEGDVKATKKKLTWLGQHPEAHPVEALLVDYDYLITKKKLEEDDDIEDVLTPVTEYAEAAIVDANVAQLSSGAIIQFERIGYFIVDKTAVQSELGLVTLIRIPDGKAAMMASKHKDDPTVAKRLNVEKKGGSKGSPWDKGNASKSSKKNGGSVLANDTPLGLPAHQDVTGMHKTVHVYGDVPVPEHAQVTKMHQTANQRRLVTTDQKKNRIERKQPTLEEAPGIDREQSLETLGIDRELARALQDHHGMTTATSTQSALFQEMAAAERHVVVQQETGAGKTLAILASALSRTLAEYHLLLSAGHKRTAVLDALSTSTLVVVPNRELALQLEKWAHQLLKTAYPTISPVRMVQRFVVRSTSKENDDPECEFSSRREMKVMDRHGPPCIALGTHRRLLEVLGDPSNALVVRPPVLMRSLLGHLTTNTVHEPMQLLQELQAAKQKKNEGVRLEDYTGLRRLVVDEIDSTLDIDSRRNAPLVLKRRRAPKPRPGQVLIKSVLEVCGSTPLLANILDSHSPRVLYTSNSSETTPISGPNVYVDALATSIKDDTTWKELASAACTDTQRLSQIFANVSMAVTKRLSTRPTVEEAKEAPTPLVDVPEPTVRMDDARLSTASPFSLQVVAAAATPTRRARAWLRNNGCIPGDTAWLQQQPLVASDNTTTTGGKQSVPSTIRHHCIIIEDETAVRNLRPKTSSTWTEGKEDKERAYAKSVLQQQQRQQPLPPLAELTAEVAANVIEHYAPPEGPVLIFTHPSADKAGLARALRPYGIEAHDILDHFAQNPRLMGGGGRSVYIASEPAARGLDLPNADLVLVVDTPSSATSYLHMAGRTGRFGRSGRTVTVMPMGQHGFYESKMRGIYAMLGIVPEPVSIVD